MAAEAITNKLKKMEVGEVTPSPEEFVLSLAPNVKARVNVLLDLQKRKEEFEEEYAKELAKLEAKYEALFAPLYEQRSKIVDGTTVVEGNSADDKGIPEFWFKVLMSCTATRSSITDKDQDVLKYLKDITSENILEGDEPRGFKLKFLFTENPFFTNEVLEKTYQLAAEDEGLLEKAEGTKIDWKPGKDVTIKIMKKKPKKGAKPNAKPIMKTEKVESFFNFFDPPKMPSEDDDDEDMTMEDIEELQAMIESDYDIGSTIREKLIPDAAAWYTGEAMDDEDDDEYGGDMAFEGDEDDDDEDDKPPKAPAVVAPAGQNPQECKQQ